MNKINNMQVFAQELEKNIQLYDIICKKLFPGNYISTAIIGCLESPVTNEYIGSKLREVYEGLTDGVKQEMNIICGKIGFILD